MYVETETIRIVHVSDVMAGDGTETAARARTIVEAVRHARTNGEYDYLVITGNHTSGGPQAGQQGKFKAAEEFVVQLAEGLLRDEMRWNRVFLAPGPKDIAKSDPFGLFNSYAESIYGRLGGVPPERPVSEDKSRTWWRLRVLKDLTFVGLYTKAQGGKSSQRVVALTDLLGQISTNHPMPSAYVRDYRPVVIACDSYPSELLDLKAADHGESIQQSLPSLGKHLYLLFAEGPLPVIAPQPVPAAEFYAFGRRRAGKDAKEPTGVSLLGVHMVAEHVNLEFTPLPLQHRLRSHPRSYRVSRDSPRRCDDVYGHYLKEARELTESTGASVVVVRGIPGSGVLELRRFLYRNSKSTVKNSEPGGPTRLIWHDIPNPPADLEQIENAIIGEFQSIREKLERRSHRHDTAKPLLVLAEPLNLDSGVISRRQRWRAEITKQLAGFVADDFDVTVLYFPNPTLEFNLKEHFCTTLTVRPLKPELRAAVVGAYESRIPMLAKKGEGQVNALTGGFLGFNLALCDFAAAQFRNTPGAMHISSKSGYDLFDKAIDHSIPAEGENGLSDHIDDFMQWIGRQVDGSKLVRQLRDLTKGANLRQRLRVGELATASGPLQGISNSALAALSREGVLEGTDAGYRLLLPLPFLARGGKPSIHLAFSGTHTPGEAKKLADLLKSRGCDVYFFPDPETMEGGKTWLQVEEESIKARDIFVLVCKPAMHDGLAFAAGALTREIATALQVEKKDCRLVLVEGKKKDLPLGLSEWQHYDLSVMSLEEIADALADALIRKG